MNASQAIRLSLLSSVVVFLLKWTAWWITGSVALYSDALEMLVNIAAALLAVIAVRVAAEPADSNHPWGHFKAEYMSAIAEGAMIVAAAIAILHEAVGRLSHPTPLQGFGLGASVAVVASALNAAMALFLRRQGRRLRSPALLADSAHLFSDVWSSIGLIAGVTLAKVTGWWILDPVLALLVTGSISWSGWKILRGSIGGLMDEAVPDATLREMVTAVSGTLSAAERTSDFRARCVGARTFVELKLFVADDMTVAASHDICGRIERAIEAMSPGADVVIHVEPMSLAGGGGRG